MSISTEGWHAPAPLFERYIAGSLDAATAASVEAHVLKCAQCRASLAAFAPAPRLTAVWSGVAAGLDTPRRGPIERALVRLGLSDADARLAASAPALPLAWFAAVFLVLVFCVTASGTSRTGTDIFLALAPALPCLGVAVAYGPWADPTFDLGQAAPYSAVRLLMLRTGVVLGVTVTLAALTGFLLPGHDTAVLWLLPSAALVASALALSVWVSPAWAGASTAGLWLAGVGSFWRAEGSLEPIFGSVGQLCALGLFVFASVAVVRGSRLHAYDVRRFP